MCRNMFLQQSVQRIRGLDSDQLSVAHAPYDDRIHDVDCPGRCGSRARPRNANSSIVLGDSAEDVARSRHAHPLLTRAVKEAAVAVDKCILDMSLAAVRGAGQPRMGHCPICLLSK